MIKKWLLRINSHKLWGKRLKVWGRIKRFKINWGWRRRRGKLGGWRGWSLRKISMIRRMWLRKKSKCRIWWNWRSSLEPTPNQSSSTSLTPQKMDCSTKKVALTPTTSSKIYTRKRRSASKKKLHESFRALVSWSRALNRRWSTCSRIMKTMLQATNATSWSRKKLLRWVKSSKTCSDLSFSIVSIMMRSWENASQTAKPSRPSQKECSYIAKRKKGLMRQGR